jgi:hypothetical protein
MLELVSEEKQRVVSIPDLYRRHLIGGFSYKQSIKEDWYSRGVQRSQDRCG